MPRPTRATALLRVHVTAKQEGAAPVRVEPGVVPQPKSVVADRATTGVPASIGGDGEIT